MYSTAILVTALATLLDTASAHGFVKTITAGGRAFPGSDPVWFYHPASTRPVTTGWDALNQDNGFVEPAAFGSADINCHKSATAGKSYVELNAGDKIDFQWNTWPDSHKGPIINYIAPCNGDCSTLSPSSLRWTKISQGGLITPGGSGYWVTDEMMDNNFVSSTVIPRNLKAGNYVIRHEIIALHGGNNDNGAQMYPQCINLKVGGSGTAVPPGGVAGTSLYKRTDPGILFNLYVSPTSYPFPGPALWTGAN
ncbi:glycoside hydrolase [Corynespora cassiicola Philippines]|uniref:Glycoside hydrolase n=1 Tax=Corynespora cassiicola Philippines TaxID=1448308 RepID=A0A2T2NLY9_CORCC|nr:glycoside hydrolase [Corynespora cassiicola Philippines]